MRLGSGKQPQNSKRALILRLSDGHCSPGEFPNLGRNYEVIAPFSDRYNCIAHSLGEHGRWISPRTGPASNRLAWVDKVYGEKGYARLATMDTSPEPGVRKVVVYGSVNRDGSVRKVLHAALQRPDGTWTSKMGHGGLIRHPTPGSVAGGIYGRPIAVYARVA